MLRVSLPHSHLHCTTLIRNVNTGIDRLGIRDRFVGGHKKDCLPTNPKNRGSLNKGIIEFLQSIKLLQNLRQAKNKV